MNECITTMKWEQAFACPDICGSKRPKISRNIANPSNSRKYVTVGCMACPKELKFIEKLNVCLDIEKI